MDTISTQKVSDNTLRYCDEIRINRREYSVYKESKTFNTQPLAELWR